MAPELLAELAQIDGIEGLKQSNDDEIAADRRPRGHRRQRRRPARARLDIGGAGGICVASHVVGNEMRRMFDEPDARAEIDASLQEIYEALFVTASPAPVKAALEMLGHAGGGLRLPLVEFDDAERALVRDVLARPRAAASSPRA